MAGPLSPRHGAGPVARAAVRAVTAAALLGTLVAACASGRQERTFTPEEPPPPLDLAGTTVMVLPAQRTALPFPDGIDAEIEFFLTERGQRTDWIFPDRLERASERNPGWRLRLDALSLGALRDPEVEEIGEPLYTDLRRLGGLLDARLALVPVAAGIVNRPAREPAEGEPAAAREEAGRRVEIIAALIDTFGGRVLWYGTVAGETVAEADRRMVATAAEALAQALVPF